MTVLQHFDDETNNNVLKDIPPLTDAEVASFTSTELVGRLLKSKIFRSIILSCIITNSLLIAVETDRNLVMDFIRQKSFFMRQTGGTSGSKKFKLLKLKVILNLL